VPGFTGSKEDFLPLLSPLAAAGFRTVAVDGRGQHETGGARDESAYAQSELARDAVAQARALRADGCETVHLLGHSLGGLVARAAVLDAEAPAATWESLTLMNSGPAAISAPQQGRTELLIGALATMSMEAVWEVMREMEGGDTPDGSGTAAEVADFLRRRWLNTVPEQLTAAGRQMLAEPDRVGELAAVRLPKLVVSGSEDVTWPVPWLDDMARRLSAERVLISGGGHSPNIRRPRATAAALVGFWARSRIPADRRTIAVG
jgi:pimeloyl-ACP methyl ester carboxylesterase